LETLTNIIAVFSSSPSSSSSSSSPSPAAASTAARLTQEQTLAALPTDQELTITEVARVFRSVVLATQALQDLSVDAVVDEDATVTAQQLVQWWRGQLQATREDVFAECNFQVGAIRLILLDDSGSGSGGGGGSGSGGGGVGGGVGGGDGSGSGSGSGSDSDSGGGGSGPVEVSEVAELSISCMRLELSQRMLDLDATLTVEALAIAELGRCEGELKGKQTVIMRTVADLESRHFFTARLQQVSPSAPDIRERIGTRVDLDVGVLEVDGAGAAVERVGGYLQLKLAKCLKPTYSYPCSNPRSKTSGPALVEKRNEKREEIDEEEKREEEDEQKDPIEPRKTCTNMLLVARFRRFALKLSR
jgi:hypothetical protein